MRIIELLSRDELMVVYEHTLRLRRAAESQRDALLADAEQIIGYLPRHENAVVPRFAVEDLAEAVRRIRENETTRP